MGAAGAFVRGPDCGHYRRGDREVGAAVSIALASLGASIYLIGRRLNRLERVATKARALGVDAAFCLADISPSSGLLGATQRIKAELRHVDILVQNAAIYAAGSIEDADLSDFSRAQRLSWANGERDEWF